MKSVNALNIILISFNCLLNRCSYHFSLGVEGKTVYKQVRRLFAAIAGEHKPFHFHNFSLIHAKCWFCVCTCNCNNVFSHWIEGY